MTMARLDLIILCLMASQWIDSTGAQPYNWPCGGLGAAENGLPPRRRPQYPPCQDLYAPYYSDYNDYPDCCQWDYYCANECVDYPWPQQPELPVTEPPESERCPISIPGWISILNETVWMYLGSSGSSSGMAWLTAEAKALEQGGVIAQIDSEEKSREIMKVVRKCYPDGSRIWIGGNDLANQGDWAWSSGEAIEDFFNWKNPPDVQDDGLGGVKPGEECLQIVAPSSKWIRSRCSDQNGDGFLAEKQSISKELNETTTTIATPSPPLTTSSTTTTSPTTTSTSTKSSSSATTTTTTTTSTTTTTTTFTRPTAPPRTTTATTTTTSKGRPIFSTTPFQGTAPPPA